MSPALIIVIVLVFLVLMVVFKSIRIVPEYQRLVVFRLGRLLATKGPGLVILIPFVDKGTIVDLREFYLEIPRQDSITKDNAAISIDFIMYYKVFEPAMSVVQVSNFAGAATNIAATTLRAVVGDISLDDVLAKRDEINTVLRVKLDEVTERWGVKVTNVEIREIIPPAVGPGGDDAADVRRADAARRRHRGGGRQAGVDHRRRGQQGGGDPQRRGRRSSPRSSPPRASGRRRSCGPRASRSRCRRSTSRRATPTCGRCSSSTSRR